MRLHVVFQGIAILVIGLSCAPHNSVVFKNPEIAYLRSLFRPNGSPPKATLGKPELEKAALASFRQHPEEILPVLIKGWNEGWKSFPWKEATPSNMSIPPCDRDLLRLLVCIDPTKAELVLIQKLAEVENQTVNDPFRVQILSDLIFRLNSDKWMKHFKALAEQKPDQWGYLFICCCAEDNKPNALPTAKNFLCDEKNKMNRLQSQAYVFQMDNNVEALKGMVAESSDAAGALVPLWSLIFMGRRDVVEKMQARPPFPDVLSAVLDAADKWETERAKPPCDKETSNLSLFELIAMNRYTHSSPKS